MNSEKHTEARRMLCRYLADLAKEKGISQEEIARRTGFTQSNVSRMFAGRYAPSLDNFIRLADAVDAYFFIIDKDSKDDLAQTMRDRWKRAGSES